MNKKGLAQIPLMIGLLIMAVVVPIATRLVQQNQDTRNLATGCSASVIGQCGANGGCSTGYRCIYGANTFHCSYDPACGGFTPTNTPRPPTAIPTRAPTPITGPCNSSTAGLCGIAGGCPIGQKCQGPIYTCISNSSCPGYIPTIMPTLYPTPNTCFAASGRPENCFCENDYQCITGYCFTGTPRTCKIRPTATPTKRPPTVTPTPNPCSVTSGKPIGCSCSYVWECASGRCISGKCTAILPTATPTPSCLANGRITSSASNCCSGYAAYLGSSLTCTTAPTATPTKRPTATPTKRIIPTSIPCASTGQACTTRSCCTTADVCTDEGLSYPVCVPRNQIPTYIPIPTIDCAKSGQGCSTRPCCEAYLDVCTDEGLSYPRCVPRNQIPTYIPIPTIGNCAKIGESCSQFKGCCGATDKCVSGKCIASATPTIVVPPVYPTSQPTNPPQPGDKCPGAEACPNSSNKNLLQNCTPADSDGTPKESSCTTVGRIEPCGGKNYCCPSTGGAWTTDMTKCPTTCTKCAGKPDAKSKGDADCSGSTNLNDASIWRDEFIKGELGTINKNTWQADFDCNGKVNLNDISIWRDNFIKSL